MAADDQHWLWHKTGERCVAGMKKRGFDAHLAADVETAREIVLGLVADCATFGFGGSETTRALGLPAALENMGKTVYDHWAPALSPAALMETRLRQGRCDCFFCSANAIAETGEIVNVDGIGNRTAAMSFGPRRVVIVAGLNKVTPDLPTALRRVREVAGPMRAKSLGMKTPCAETGVCSDCRSPQRICNITTILHFKPMLTEVAVVLVNAALGY